MEMKLRIEEILTRKEINLAQLAKQIHRSAPNLYNSLNNNPQFELLKSIANGINKIERQKTFDKYFGTEKENIPNNIRLCKHRDRKKIYEEYLIKRIHISDLIARESTVYGYLSFEYREIEYSKTFDELNGFNYALSKCLTSSRKVKIEDIFNSQMSNKSDKNLIISRIMNLLTPDNDNAQVNGNEGIEVDPTNEFEVINNEDKIAENNDINNNNDELFDDKTIQDILKQITEALNELIKLDADKKEEQEKLTNQQKTDNENSVEKKKNKIPIVLLQNLIISITSNPTLKRLSNIAKVLNLSTKDLLSDTPKFQLRGIVNLNGEMITVESVRDLYYLKEKSKEMTVSKFNDDEIIEQIKKLFGVKNEYKIVTDTDGYQKEFSQVIDPKHLDMTKESIYDGKAQLCYSFRKRGDTRYGIELNFSNMIKLNQRMTCLGHQFWDSECAYIAGYYSLYDNTNEGITYKKIQERLSEYSKGGYNAKGIYRKATNEYTIKLRTDFHISNLNFEWMKIVIFEKAKTNDEFRNALLSIPSNAHIIEDTSYFKIGPSSTAMIWGCQNKVLTKDRIKYRSKIRMKLALENADNKTIANAEQTIDNLICDNGEWVGQNATGKAIKLVQLALIEGGIPPINFDLINNNENGFYWFGDKIRIIATADGNDITYEVIGQ